MRGVSLDDEGPLARLMAGGRHVRLLVMGRLPAAISLPPLKDFERVARIGPGSVIVDPLRLPFTEALFDKALVATLLPPATARGELREQWRVLAPAGLLLLVVKARRRWQWRRPGWRREALEPVLDDAMFEVLDWQVATLPERYHLILLAKRDGLRPAMIGRAEASEVPATAN